MFRREAWTSVGGFPDDAAQPFTDFVAVIERGLEGRWLSGPEEARQLSRRPPPAEPAVHLRQMTELYRRHASTVSAQGTTLLLEKERVLLEARERHDSLNGQRHELASELATLQRAIDETLAELAQFAGARVDLGDLATTAPIAPYGAWTAVSRWIAITSAGSSSDIARKCAVACSKSRTRATRTFGDGRVVSSDVIDIDPDNDEATITADLTMHRASAMTRPTVFC